MSTILIIASATFLVVFIVITLLICIAVYARGDGNHKPKVKQTEKSDDNSKEEKTNGVKKRKGDNLLAEKMVALLVVVAILAFWKTIPYPEQVSVSKNGMLFIPIFGLLKATIVTTAFAVAWSLFDETESSFGAICIVTLTAAGVVVFVGSMVMYIHNPMYSFAPVGRDPTAPTLLVLLGAVGIVLMVYVFTRKNVDYTIMAAFAVVAVWLPQLAPSLMGFLAKAVF